MTRMHEFIAGIHKGNRPLLTSFIEVLGPSFPLLYKLEETVQDKGWHAEGNVFIHTHMVLNETYEIIETVASPLGADQKLILILAAVLHDIAKPITTRNIIKDGRERVGAPGHEYKGGSYLAYRIFDLGLTYPITRKLLELITYHNQPKLMVVKNCSVSRLHQLYRQADLELLYYLELADMRGRRCADQQSQIDYIELYKMVCHEAQVWQNAPLYDKWAMYVQDKLSDKNNYIQNYVFAHAVHDFENGRVFSIEEALARSYESREKHAHLYIMCGPSGSGKTTWIKNNLPHASVISLDDLRQELSGSRTNQKINGQVLQKAKNLLRQALRNHETVVWDATSLRKDFRAPLIQLAYDYKALTTIVLQHKSLKYIVEGNRNRRDFVASSVLEAQINSFQWAEVSEAHQHLVVNSDHKVVYEIGTLKGHDLSSI